MASCVDQPTSPDREIADADPIAALSTPITQTLLTAGNDPANKKNYTTAAISPAPNALITVAVLSHRGGGASVSPTVTGGGMAAWTEVSTITFSTIATPQKRLTIYRALSPSPGSGPITIAFPTAVANAQWIVSQWSGVDLTGVNGAGAIGQTGSTRANSGTGLTVTLAPFADPNNVAYGVFGVRKNVLAITPGAGFTEISEQPSGEAPPADLQAEWATNDNTINASWASTNAAVLGVEIKAGGGGGGGGVSASQSTVTAAPGSIAVGSGTATITVTAKDASGNPVSGATVVLSASGTGNTLTQPVGPTNGSGVATGTLSSSVAETKTISATANGTAITQTATVEVQAVAPGSITHALLTGGTDTTNQKVYTTGSIAPAPNTLITIAVLGHRGVAATPSPIVTGGGMAAWEEVATVVFDSLSIPSKRMTIYRAMSASPGSGPLTITFANTVSNAQWIVSQWSGVDLSGVNGAGAIVQTGSASADRVTTLTVTLNPFAHANNVAYGVVGVKKNVPAVNPGAGFTEIDEQPSGETTTCDLQAEWATNDNTINATWTRANSAVLGVEIRAADTGT
ncbi:MAG TPA: Ig-like domain-containing protein [Gemmatimonadales bacterium]|jgi:hypothetical protein